MRLPHDIAIPPRLEQLLNATPSGRGPDGTKEMLRLRDTYLGALQAVVRQLLQDLAGVLEQIDSPLTTLTGIDAREAERARLDASVVIPRPEAITTVEQCDTMLWDVSHVMSQIQRMWNVATTVHSRVGYEVELLGAWLRCRLIDTDRWRVEAQIRVLLAEPERVMCALEAHIANCERSYKRLEYQLPSLRDIADRRYQSSRFRPDTSQGGNPCQST